MVSVLSHGHPLLGWFGVAPCGTGHPPRHVSLNDFQLCHRKFHRGRSLRQSDCTAGAMACCSGPKGSTVGWKPIIVPPKKDRNKCFQNGLDMFIDMFRF